MKRKRIAIATIAFAGTVLAGILVTGSPPAAPQDAGEPDAARIDAVRLNTLGAANLTRQSTVEALALFEQAYESDPTFTTARLNQGIALFNLQRFEEALDILTALTVEIPDYTRAWYNLGWTLRTLGRSEEAAETFGRAAELDPNDPDIHSMHGLMLFQDQRYEESIAAFERALALSPNHASATFGLSRTYSLMRDVERAREVTARYQEIQSLELSTPLGMSYGEQGAYALAEDASDLARRPENAIEVRFEETAAARGIDWTHSTSGDGAIGLLGGGACVLDYDDNGSEDLFLAGDNEDSGLFRNSGDGNFERVDIGEDLSVSALGCTAGDFDNDGFIDLAVGNPSGVSLLRNTDGGGFEDVSMSAGLPAPGPGGDAFPLGLTFIDFDHDGDLDLYVVWSVNFSAPEGREAFMLPADVISPGNTLWRNNGNGTFTDWTDETGMASFGPGTGVVGTDIDNDRDVDFVLTGWGNAPEIRLNPRSGVFDAFEWTEQFPSAPAGVVVIDFDKDSWMDLAFTHWSPPGITLWRNLSGERFEQAELPALDWSRGWGIAALDYDNDGWIDLAAVGEAAEVDEIRVFRNRGVDGFEDTTAALALSDVTPIRPRALAGADYDADGDIDLLLTQNGDAPLLLNNDGGNANSWLGVRLEGLADNKSGIGTKVEIFSGILRQKVEVHASGGYLGQNALPVNFGLGNNDEADSVRLLWPTGVPQDETLLQAGQTHDLLESDRRGSSCPVLFCWNGETYEFVTDAIGAGVVGHWVAPGQRNISDPTEYIKIPGSSVALRDGMLSFRMAEPMEELVYLDQVRLLAVDHPAGVEVYPHEYFAAVPPFPEFEVIASRDARLPAGAWDDSGRDVSDRLRAIDRRYVDGFAPGSFTGFAETHSLELDLGDIDTRGPVRLLMHGFIEYFTATSVFAAHQAGVVPILPYIEAHNADGEWVRVMDDLGFPAGLARSMARDITGRLPEGARRIRITTNLKIYWDRILVDTTPGDVPFRITEAPLSEASLDWLGYPLAEEGALKADISYVYDRVSPTGPYARHAGAYTPFGDVRDLSTDSDDMFVVFGSGEEVRMEFDPSGLPPLPDGWTRDYFFYADGFAKDMDFYEAHSGTVEPLPYHTEEPYPYASGRTYPNTGEYLDYQLQINTRHESGAAAATWQYQYD